MSEHPVYLDHVALFEGTAREDVREWLVRNRAEVEGALQARGAVLLRGFGAEGDTIAEETLNVLTDELLDDAFWSTPRSGVAKKTFTATEYPGPRTISLHSEMAYMPAWPRFVLFHSIHVAEEGGQTTIGDLDQISRDLDDVLPTFEPGVIYKRTYHSGVDIPWQTAFRTEDKREAEQVARKAAMTTQWLDGDVLQTTHHAQGCVRAEDGRLLWFNQTHVFHPSNLDAKNREGLTTLFGIDQLPRNSFYRDGTQIPDATIARVHEVLTRNTIKVEWQRGDVLFLDNMRFMHGRMPFSGTRKLHVALGRQQKEPRRTSILAARPGQGLGARLRNLFGR